MNIEFKLNGEIINTCVDPTKVLLDFLREDVGLTGVKKGCEIGECGACTILLNKKAVSSCMVLVGQIHGQEILTIEGLKSELINCIEKSLLDAGAVQCGFCTPAMIMSILSLLYENPNPTSEQIRRCIDGNLCRCTGYRQIIESAENMKLNEIKL